MRKMIFTAALAAILAITIAACGGDDGEGAEERLHPVLWDAIYLQIQEGQEYITMWSPEQKPPPVGQDKRHPPRGLRDPAHDQRRMG